MKQGGKDSAMSDVCKKTIGLVCIVLVLVCFHVTALAYVLHGKHILKLMTEKIGQAKGLFISQKVTFFYIEPPPQIAEADDEDSADTSQVEPSKIGMGKAAAVTAEDRPAPDVVEMDESLRYLISEAFRSDIITDDNQRIHVFANGEALTIIGGAVRATSQTRFDLYKDVLLFRTRPELVDRLSRLGVDVSVSSLGRIEGQIAYVIGAQYPDESVDQLWVDHTTFRPLRWIIVNGTGGFSSNPLDVRYLDWWQLDDTFWYPSRIEFYQNNQLVRMIKVQRYEVDPAFSRDLFDIEQLRSNYPEANPALNEPESVSDVQQTIEDFSKMFE
jgi:hypothetical protein